MWRSLLAEAPAGAPWVGFVRGALARVSGAPVVAAEPGPNADDVAAAADHERRRNATT